VAVKRKDERLSKWTARFMIAVLLVGGLYLQARGADCTIQASWNFPTWRIIYSQEADGTLVFKDTITDGRQSIDTTMTGTDGKLNIWHFLLWEDSTGLPWSYLVYRDLNTNADLSESWNTDSLFLPDTVDTCVQELLRDGSTIATRNYANVAVIPETTWTVSGGSFNEILYRYKYDATDSFTTFALAYDLLGDSVSGGAVPTVGKSCIVTAVVKTFQGLPDSGKTIVVYPVRNFVKDSSGQIITLGPVSSTTNGLGQATFQLMWSDYFIPSLNYQFVMITPYGSLRKVYHVPSTTTHTFDLNR
jgi:hypothetical protein